MLKREALTDKILVLGVDGMDPSLSRKYVDMGIMPNLKSIIEQGSARHDLMLLGAHPTITPPMWTTLATGCTATVHGIFGFYMHKPEDPLDTGAYSLNSHDCRAELVWNCFAEAGKKTLVWHWPGSSWPPTSDSPNLLVVDGSSPGSVGAGKLEKDSDFLVEASEQCPNLTVTQPGGFEGTKACVVDFGEETAVDSDGNKYPPKMVTIKTKESQLTGALTDLEAIVVSSPITNAKDWVNTPEDAKEFTILFSGGLVRRPALLLKGESGHYEYVEIYKNKKASSPIVRLLPQTMAIAVVDEAIVGARTYQVNRNIKVLELAADGSWVKMYVSPAMDIESDEIFSPKELKNIIYENIGYLPSSTMLGNQDPVLITDCMLANWDVAVDWQARALLYMIEKENVEVIFSHMHNVDLQTHLFIKYMSGRHDCKLPQESYEKFMQDVYKQTDRYLGYFTHLLNEDWTILIVSDHAQVSHKYDQAYISDPGGVNVPIMEKLGYTVLKKDASGNSIDEIDWSQTTAVSLNELQIFINLKGRNPHGIVDPADKYELEEKIMTDLYGLRDPVTGHRIIAVALRNKDAVLLGQGGPDAGDICCFVAEGYTFDHGDTLSTAREGDTSVSPIFVAAGRGIKRGYETDRIIREVDFAPTVAVLGGVRMPAQCEGAPVYQILTEEY